MPPRTLIALWCLPVKINCCMLYENGMATWSKNLASGI
jgi:hypothetical protein